MPVTRRTLLKAAAAAAAMRSGLARAATAGQRRVLVVGAGAAGLTAAFELAQAGHDVVVFEARSRPGGRMHTLRDEFDDGLYAEAGALYLLSNNPGLEYAREFGLEVTPIAFRTDLGSIAHIDGVNVGQLPGAAPEWPLDLPEEDAGLSVNQLQTKYHRKVIYGMDGLARTLDEDFPQPDFLHLDRMSLADFWRSNGASDAAMRIMRLRYFDGYGDGIESVSALQLARESASFSGATGAYRIDGGNDRICAEMAERLPTPVRFDTPVIALLQNADQVRVVVDGPGGSREVTGDYAIVTAPLPVQARIDFRPALSALRAAAIREIQTTDVCRVFVQTRSRFWEDAGLDGSAVTDLPIGAVGHATAGQPGGRGILESFSYGERARRMAALPEEQRFAAAVRGIGKVYAPLPDQAERGTSYDWGGDPWARGGHAAFAPGQVSRFFAALSGPEGRVYFAGDAIGGVPGYSHAAFQSGREVARRIAAL